jgi:hypothetical protein
MVAVTVEAILESPCAKVGITITDLGVGDSVVTVWRIADGERESVQGYRRVLMNDATYVEDWAAPLGRPITYEVEVLSGPGGAVRVTSDPVTVDSLVGYVQDALVPQSAIPITKRRAANGGPVLASKALAALEYAADVSVYKIMGSNKPMALFGERMAAAGVDFSMITDAAEENTKLRRLFMSAGQILVRLPASWGGALGGTCFLAVANVSERPLNAGSGGFTTSWDLAGDVTQAPAIRVLTATFTYGDVEILLETYQQKQDLMAGKTYLDDLKNPIGG